MADLPYLEDVENLLLGGAITLIGTLIVQIIVVPQVQWRTRARQRWEDDVIKLTTLINETLLEKLARLEVALLPVQEAQGQLTARGGQDAYEAFDKAWDEAVPAWQEVAVLPTEIAMTLRRCVLIHPRAPYWAGLINQATELRQLITYLRADGVDARSLSSEEIGVAIKRLRDANDALSTNLQRITEPLKPPKEPRRQLAIGIPKRKGPRP